jgi:NUDIX domain
MYSASIVQQEPDAMYRLNAAVFIFNRKTHEVLVFERLDGFHWQFPQGGIDQGEDSRTAGASIRGLTPVHTRSYLLQLQTVVADIRSIRRVQGFRASERGVCGFMTMLAH